MRARLSYAAALALGAMLGSWSAPSKANLLAYEGFGDVANENDSINGYSGSNAEVGLAGAWSLSGTGSQKLTKRSTAEYVGVAGGFQAEYTGGNQHWWEHNNNWNVNTASRALGSAIDLSADGTTYMSFFVLAGHTDFLAQVGLANGANEIMFGNAYSGNASKGFTGYFGPLGSDVLTNGNGTFVSHTEVSGAYKTGFYLAELIKSNSGTTDDLQMNLSYWDFGVMAAPTNTLDTPDGARSIALTGVTGSFDSLRIKLSGGSTYPSVDEIRVGTQLADATGVPEPTSVVLMGSLAFCLLGARRMAQA
jgi:hypothetical protein